MSDVMSELEEQVAPSPEDAADAEPEVQVDAQAEAQAEPEVPPEPEAEPALEPELPSSAETQGASDAPPAADSDAETAAEDDDVETAATAPDWLPAAIEAIVFCSTEPVTVARIRELLAGEGEDLPAPVIRRAIKTLLSAWRSEERAVARGFELAEIGGGLVFRTLPDHARFLRRMFATKPQKLSRAALETLAIIAYRQPLTRPQIDEIRGVDSSAAVKALLEKKLIRVLGKADDVGRPLLYGTTKTFLEFFGLTSLRDLPTLKDYRELQGEEEPTAKEESGEPQPAVVMDLFASSEQRALVSSETEQESQEALSALEQALGAALEVQRRTAEMGPGGKPPPSWRGDSADEEDDATSLEDEGDIDDEPSQEASSEGAPTDAPEGDAPPDEELAARSFSDD